MKIVALLIALLAGVSSAAAQSNVGQPPAGTIQIGRANAPPAWVPIALAFSTGACYGLVPLPLACGGTNAILNPSAGGIVYSTGIALGILPGTPFAGRPLISGANGAPSWWSVTLPFNAGSNGQVLQTNGGGNSQWVSTKSLISFVSVSTMAQNTTSYFSMAPSTTESVTQTPVSYSGTIKNAQFFSATAPGNGQTHVYTLRKNGADTAITATVSGTAQTASDTSHTVTVVPGDLIDIKFVSSSGAQVSAGAAGLELDTP